MGEGTSLPVLDQAKDILTKVSDFSKNLSSADTDVQKALETIDQLTLGGTETDPLSLHLSGDNTTGLAIDISTSKKITGEMAKVVASAPSAQKGDLWLDPSGTPVNTSDHAGLSHLSYATAGHTGFEPAITAGTSAQFLKGDKSLGTVGTLLGAPVSKTIGTVYQAATDGIVIAWSYSSAGYQELAGVTDASNPPTTSYITADSANAANYCASITYFVRKGDYYKTTAYRVVTGGAMFFYPLGT